MPVHRISKSGLQKIIDNNTIKEAVCIVKFYSNECHYCHALHDYYVDLSNEYGEGTNTYFYAFNVFDEPSYEKILNFNGVPTILAFKTNPNNRLKKSKHFKLEDPDNPNEKTWYRVKDIKNFIEKHRN